MKLNLDALAVIDAIARKGSFAAAAEELYRVPSAITYTVQKLEQDLDLKLFDRSGHRARLTSAGEELLREGRKLLQAAHALESRVQQIATGTEPELTIAISDALPIERLLPLICEFYDQNYGTRVRVLQEVLGGVWDALASGRAQLAIAAPGDGPGNQKFKTDFMGHIRFTTVVGADHPLATYKGEITDELLIQYRAVAAADSSRNLPPQTANLLSDQDVLTLPTIQAKYQAHLANMGVGSVPCYMAEADIAAGRLVELDRPAIISPPLYLAWHEEQQGKAVKWFIREMQQHSPFAELVQKMA